MADDELAALERELAALRGEATTSTASPPPYETAPIARETDSEKLVKTQREEMEELQRQLAALRSTPSISSSSSSGPPKSESQRLIEQQKAEMEELKRQLATVSAPPPKSESQRLIEQQKAEMEELKRQLAKASAPPPKSESQRLLEQQKAELEELKRQMAAMAGGSSSGRASAPKSESERLLDQQRAEMEELKRQMAELAASKERAEMEALQRELLALRATSSSSVSYTSSSSSSALEAERRKLRELEEKKHALSMLPDSSRTATHGLEAKEAELSRLRKELESSASIATLEAKRAETQRLYERAMYGVDVCFLMDCTGSMSSWITTAKQKIVDLMGAIKNIPASRTPHLRVGFVGYRDYGDDERFIPVDFFDLDNPSAVSSFQARLGTIVASGGGDGPEDIAGAMDYALKNMKWVSSTRLVIHLADAPCHGTKYNDGGDSYPAGDPNGLVPETLLSTFASKSIAYNFGAIDPSYTNKMTNVFQEHMRSIGKESLFQVLNMNASTESFLPVVVKSISKSMELSGLYK